MRAYFKTKVALEVSEGERKREKKREQWGSQEGRRRMLEIKDGGMRRRARSMVVTMCPSWM